MQDGCGPCLNLMQPMTAATASSPLQQLPVLEMSDLGGRRIVAVIRAVEVCYRRIDELINIDAIQAIDANGIKLPAELGISPHPKERTPQCLQNT